MKKKVADRHPFASRFREWFKSSWWITFSASLVATVLGIALTFGVNQRIDSVKQKKFLRTSKLVAMAEIRRGLEFNASLYEYRLLPVKEAIKEVTKYTASDSLKYLGREVVASLGYGLLTEYVNPGIHFTEEMFHSSSELWKYEDKYSEIEAINKMFHDIRDLEVTIDLFEKEIGLIRENHYEVLLSMSFENNFLDGLRALFRDKKAMYRCTTFLPYIVDKFETDFRRSQWFYEQTMEQLGFTEEDLDVYDRTIDENDWEEGEN